MSLFEHDRTAGITWSSEECGGGAHEGHVEGSLTHILLHIFCGRHVLACEQAALDPSGSSTLFSDARGTFGIGRLAIEGADGTGAAAAATTPPLSPPLVGLGQPRDDDHHQQPPQRASHAGRHGRRASKRAPARAAPFF